MVPMEAIKKIKFPVFLLHGGRDTRLPAQNSYRIHANAHQQSQVWFVPEAKHTDLYKYLPESYIDKLLEYYSSRLLY